MAKKDSTNDGNEAKKRDDKTRETINLKVGGDRNLVPRGSSTSDRVSTRRDVG